MKYFFKDLQIFLSDMRAFLAGRCRFFEVCPRCDRDSFTCNHTSGQYHADKMATCYNDMETLEAMK
jgi:hypothetical protein